MNALANGLIGAAVLATVHQAGASALPDAPRVDIVGRRAVARLFRLAGVEPPGESVLYPLATVGALLSDGLYYSAVGNGRSRALWPRAAALGLAAGVGAIVLPEPLGLGKPPHIEHTRTKVLTVAWYLLGALAAAGVARAGARRGAPQVPRGEHRS